MISFCPTKNPLKYITVCCLTPTPPVLPVFFMADVSELRIELIFPRSTLARLTPRGADGVFVAVADVEVTEVVVTAAEALVLKTFAGVLVTFEDTSDFVVFETAEEGLSFLSPVNNSKS